MSEGAGCIWPHIWCRICLRRWDDADCRHTEAPVTREWRDRLAEAEARALREFVQWIASARAYNGSEYLGQVLYDYGLNAVLPLWAEEFRADRLDPDAARGERGAGR